MCTATLSGGPLSCILPEGHLSGHAFQAQNGSWVDDHHDEGGHG